MAVEKLQATSVIVVEENSTNVFIVSIHETCDSIKAENSWMLYTDYTAMISPSV